jgi:RNA polymerase sigma factor (TIGR02999 family)
MPRRRRVHPVTWRVAIAGWPGGLRWTAAIRARLPVRPAPGSGRGDASGSARATVPMNEVTRILSAIEQGDPHAAEQLLPLVYDELRKLAAARLSREKPGQTLQATALVHEAYLRLVDVDRAQAWNSRGHFFAAAAEAMRRLLVDKARQKHRLKRGRDLRRVDLDAVEVSVEEPPDDLIALDEALTRLAQKHPDKAALVKLRYFAGLTIDEAARVLGISAATADRHWAYARAWLYRQVAGDARL